MFSFFRRKKQQPAPNDAQVTHPEPTQAEDASASTSPQVEESVAQPQSAPLAPSEESAAVSTPAEPIAVEPVAAEPVVVEPVPAETRVADSVEVGPESAVPAAEQPEAQPQSPVAGSEPSVARSNEPPTIDEPSAPDAAVAAPSVETQPEPTTATVQPAAPPADFPTEQPAKRSWFARLKQGLARTGQSLGGIFVGVKVDEDLFEELETALIMADAGVEATEKLLSALRARVKKERLTDAQAVKAALREILADHLRPLEKPFPLHSAKPLVVMIAGVNGAGKTTSIGKLAHAFQAQNARVLLAAADTFRAAAREQLMEWGARNQVTVISQEGGDPAAVAFDAVNAGRAREADVVMVDTAGRLPTQLHLMDELRKIRRVISKADASSPHEVLLVVDGNTGQNAISQVKAFDAAIGLTGLVVTKLDGTAKGGTLAAIAAGSQGVRPIPVYWIGVGEGMHDLQPFVASEFSAALLGD